MADLRSLDELQLDDAGKERLQQLIRLRCFQDGEDGDRVKIEGWRYGHQESLIALVDIEIHVLVPSGRYGILVFHTRLISDLREGRRIQKLENKTNIEVGLICQALIHFFKGGLP